MGQVHFFQRYHVKENRHSSATCLLLSYLYNYNPSLFYKLISSIFEFDVDRIYISFITQDKVKDSKSIPDFSVAQEGFKLSVEAKENADTSKYTQLENHATALRNERVYNKCLLLLLPKVGNDDSKNIEKLKGKFPDISFRAITYFELYSFIKELLIEVKDDDMIEILEDFRDYCEEENLLNKSNETMMVRLAGLTMGRNIKYNIYHDLASHKSTGFSYLGLYKDKCVKYVGKIRTIVTCKLIKDNVEIIENVFGILNENDIDILKECLVDQQKRGDDMSKSYSYFFVEHYYETNFRKTSKYALYGRKKFNLSEYVKNVDDAETVAEALRKYTW